MVKNGQYRHRKRYDAFTAAWLRRREQEQIDRANRDFERSMQEIDQMYQRWAEWCAEERAIANQWHRRFFRRIVDLLAMRIW